jgi:glucans biosynthesis protein C
MITNSANSPMPRHYEVDWLRVLAMGLLILYHIALCFQPWASLIAFPQNGTFLEIIWPPMAMLNVWRIPLLFLISGMGVSFAMDNRDWKELLKDRFIRIVVPFIFGSYILGWLLSLLMPIIGWHVSYTLHFGHLWFLVNIFCYLLWLIGIIIYLKNSPDNPFSVFLANLMQKPFGLFLFTIPLILEAWLVNPKYYSMYVDTVHGWLLGLICFFLGFIFIEAGDSFWTAVRKNSWTSLCLALTLFLLRLLIFELQNAPNALTAFESMSWMFAVIGFASKLLNRSSICLSYFSEAVYPVYILHLPIQFAIAYLVFPLQLSAWLKMMILLAATFGSCLLIFEFVIKRVKWIRPLFGMKVPTGCFPNTPGK